MNAAKRKTLPPPRTRAAAAAEDRWTRHPDPAPSPSGTDPAPPQAAPTAATTPDGMTRRTYYLPTATADSLAAAVDRIETACGGVIPRHRILAAVIARGLAAGDTAIRADILHHLTQE